MSNLVESESWIDGIYQLETSDPVEGGPEGIDNVQAKQLANRTKYLKARLEAHAAAADPHAQYATKSAMVDAIAALVDSSPDALNTLKELAEALGNDAHFATTMLNALALRAMIDSPLFTGAPKGPTPAQFDGSAKLATTEFARALGIQSSGVNKFNVSTPLTTAHVGGTVYGYGTSVITLTLPSATLLSLPIGARVEIINSTVTTMNVALANGEQLNVGSTQVTPPLVLQANDAVSFVWAGTAWFAMGTGVEKYLASFTSLLGVTGYQKLPSGLIIQWGGYGTSGSSTFNPVTFPIAFPSAISSVIVTPNTSLPYGAYDWVASLSVAGFMVCGAQGGVGGVNYSAHSGAYFAIGK